jgi:hypothetical protein
MSEIIHGPGHLESGEPKVITAQQLGRVILALNDRFDQIERKNQLRRRLKLASWFGIVLIAIIAWRFGLSF